MKFRKGLIVASLSIFLLPYNSGFAASETVNSNQATGLSLVATEFLNYEGEHFELVTWQATDGTIYNTIPTEVKNKKDIAEFVDNYLKEDQISTFASTDDWSENYDESERDGRLQWYLSGYYEASLIPPITAHKRVINDGLMVASYGGSGNADKILLSYSYTFNGLTLSISAPPSLTKSGDKVSWKSQPVTNEWYVSTPSLGAKAESRTMTFDTDIVGEAEIYKGSYIYRPNVSDAK